MSAPKLIATGEPYPTCPSCGTTRLEVWNDGRVECLDCGTKWVDDEWLAPGMELGSWPSAGRFGWTEHILTPDEYMVITVPTGTTKEQAIKMQDRLPDDVRSRTIITMATTAFMHKATDRVWCERHAKSMVRHSSTGAEGFSEFIADRCPGPHHALLVGPEVSR